MNWNIFAVFLAPLIAVLAAFFLKRLFYNPPELITYYSSISFYKIPFYTGYTVNLISLSGVLDKNNLDTLYGQRTPLLIKNENSIWIYGKDIDGITKLTLSQKPEIYNQLYFTDNIENLNKINDEIYNDIKLNNAHTSITVVGTHSIVVSNAGGATARNVRIAHSILPNYNVFPSTSYGVIDLPGGGKEILFPTLVPNEQITVSYLYFPPTKYSDIHTYIKSDEGLVKEINFIPKPNFPIWQKSMIWVLSFIGGTLVIYAVLIFILHIMEMIYSSLCHIK